MKHRILLTTALVILGVSTVSAQQPTKPKNESKTKPAVTQTKVAAKPVTKTESKPVTPRGPKKVELKEAQPGLTSQATVSLDDALKTAESSVKGTVVSERIEKRGDQIVYRFGIRSGRRVRHVMVDAKTNSIVKAQAHTGTGHKAMSKKTESRKG